MFGQGHGERTSSERVANFGAGGMLEIEFAEDFLKTESAKNLTKIENFPFKNATFPEVNLKKGFVKMEVPEVVPEVLEE